MDSAIHRVNHFIIHSKYFAVSDWLISPWKILHNQPSLIKYGRYEQHTIDSMVYLLGNEVDLWYISLETRLPEFIYFLMSICKKIKSVVLVLLDLSAAFDRVDHSLLLARLSTRFGICDQALDWFRSYLSDRTQYVRIQDVSSDVHALPYGVPQGSVLGPLLYSLYTSPLGDIARSHGLCYHFYADDTQLYLSFETSSPVHLLLKIVLKILTFGC